MNTASYRILSGGLMPAILAVCLLSTTSVDAGAFRLVSSLQAATVFVPASEPECVRLAAEDFVRDTRKITGRAPALVRRAEDCGANSVVLASLDQPESAALLEKLAPGFGDGLKGQWEAHRVETTGSRLIIAGSDERGTMFGLYPNVIWQLGLRGIADRPMWLADPNTPQSDADRGRLISEAMAAQVEILDEVCLRQPRYPSTTLWAEGSALNQHGLLTIPEEAIVVFADNSPGWKWQRDFYSTPRNPRNTYGVYYHHGLIGSGPHLAQVPSPHKTYECLQTAVEKGARAYAIFNVANIREFVLGIDATAKMTWRMDSFDPDAWLADWVRGRFSKQPDEIASAYRAYFNAWQIHPEQQVPFLMDGQMFGAGSAALGQIAKKLKDKNR